MQTATHPEFDFPVNYSTSYLPGGNSAQVSATIDMMRRYAIEDSDNPIFVDALGKFQSVNSTTADPCALAFNFARSIMRFQRDEVTGSPLDPNVIEVLIRPVDAVVMCERQGDKIPGDCDCFSMLVSCALRVLGVSSSFVTVAADGGDPASYSHVYVVAWPGTSDRVAVDASHGPYVGWEAPNTGMYCEWPLAGGGYGAMVVLGFLLAALGLVVYIGGKR